MIALGIGFTRFAGRAAMLNTNEFQDFRRVQKAMEFLGFVHAAQALYDRWANYSERERRTIMRKWRVE